MQLHVTSGVSNTKRLYVINTLREVERGRKRSVTQGDCVPVLCGRVRNVKVITYIAYFI